MAAERNVDTAANAVTILNVPTDNDTYELELLEGEVLEQLEVLEGEVGTAGHLELERGAAAQRLPTRAGQPAVQAAVAAATGFVAGAAAMALLRRYGMARLERAAVAPVLEQQPPGPARTYLVHVRVLG